MADAVTNHNALLAKMEKKGLIREAASGGRTIVEPVMYGTNSSIKFYDGYDTFTPDTAAEVVDASEWAWKQLGGFITMSGRERVTNSGKHQAIDLYEAKEKHLIANMKNAFAASIFSDGTGTGGKEFGGLKLICADNPAAAGTIGGIDQVTNTWWRNKFSAAASTDKTNIIDRMNALDLTLTRGSDHTDIIIAGATLFPIYESALQPLQRFASSKSADAGFLSYSYKDKEVFYDYNCPTKSMYFLDTDSLSFRYFTDRWFDVGDARTVTNADYEVVPVWVMGNLTCSERARNGVMLMT